MKPAKTALRKRALRARFRAARKNPGVRAELDQRIRHGLLTHLEGRQGCTLGAYLAFDGEPDLAPALLALRDAGCTIALPVLAPGPTPSMQLRAWQAGAALERNFFGIDEPVAGPGVALETLDYLLMPLVAYDRTGLRLGMGGGYYDRLLAGLAPATAPLKVGVAYAAQQADAVPREEWDIPLDAVLNENGWFPFPL